MGFATHPAVAMDAGGNAVLAWGRDVADPTLGLVRSKRDFHGTGWDTPTAVPLYSDPAAASAPYVDAAGQATVSYVVMPDGQSARVYANTLR